MNEFVMDADSNSYGSDYDQGEEYGSDYSDGEYQPGASFLASSTSSHQQHHQLSGVVASGSGRVGKAKGSGAQARKMVNRGRWTKDEVYFISNISKDK